MIDNRNENFLKTGEKPLEPAEARLRVIDSFLGAATAALSYDSDVVHQANLMPFMGGHVDEFFAQRNGQRLGVEQVAAPALQAAKVEVAAMAPGEYLDRLAQDTGHVAPPAVDISPAARGAVMDSIIDTHVLNDLREAA